MDNPRLWSPLREAIELCGLTEPKEIIDMLIEKGLVPEEPYWEMLDIVSDSMIQQEKADADGVIGGSMGRKAVARLERLL